jgi:hypothetical protein
MLELQKVRDIQSPELPVKGDSILLHFHLQTVEIHSLTSLLQTNGGLPWGTQGTLQEAPLHTHPHPLALHVAEGTCQGSRWSPYPPKNSRTGVDCSLSSVAPPPTTVQALTPTTGASLQSHLVRTAAWDQDFVPSSVVGAAGGLVSGCLAVFSPFRVCVAVFATT